MSAWPRLVLDAGAEGLPACPGPELDPYLDAATRCIERYGWSRTSAKDIAREAGVERTTIYRHLGPKEQILRLLVAREVHRLIDLANRSGARLGFGPPGLIELLAESIEYVGQHPAISKLLTDDPELLSGFLARGIPEVLERFTKTLSPAMHLAMEAGFIARRDPAVTTEWIVRMGLTALVAPPQGDLRTFLAEILIPVLTPAAPSPRST